MAAALPGAISANIQGEKPVLGVALPSKEFPDGMDALLSQTRMPAGRPVACCGIGKAGLTNAAIFACSIVAISNENVRGLLSKVLDRMDESKPCKTVTLSQGD